MNRQAATLFGCAVIAAIAVVLTASPALAAPPPVFAPHVDYPTGSAPQGSAIGDLNADGVPDAVWTNYGLASNTISVALGTGGGSFGLRSDYPVGANPVTIAIGDLNHDTRPDLVVCNWSSASVSVLLGTGGGAFAAASTYATGGRPICGQLADLDGDGNLDVVVADWSSNTLTRLLGNGTGGFGAPTTYNGGTHPYGLALGDLNGDGKLDAVTTNRTTSNVSVLLGTAGGNFGAPTSFAAGSDPIWVALADVNGDGKLDAAVANFAANTVSVLPGNGSGGFGAKTDYGTGNQPISVAIGDLDVDAKPDLAVSNYADNVVSVYSGDGAGGFAARVNFTTAAGPVHFAIADLNADGRLDLAVPCAVTEVLAVLLNTNSTSPCAGQSVTVALAAGVLTITGTPCADDVRLGLSAGGGTINVDDRANGIGTDYSYSFASVNSITMTLGDGADEVIFDDSNGSIALQRSLSIDVGDGDNVVVSSTGTLTSAQVGSIDGTIGSLRTVLAGVSTLHDMADALRDQAAARGIDGNALRQSALALVDEAHAMMVQAKLDSVAIETDLLPYEAQLEIQRDAMMNLATYFQSQVLQFTDTTAVAQFLSRALADTIEADSFFVDSTREMMLDGEVDAYVNAADALANDAEGQLGAQATVLTNLGADAETAGGTYLQRLLAQEAAGAALNTHATVDLQNQADSFQAGMDALETSGDQLEAAADALIGQIVGVIGGILNDASPPLATRATATGVNCDPQTTRTIIGAGIIIGTSQNDHIIGTPLPEFMFGGAGDDKMDGNGGSDFMFGGGGNDAMDGGGGFDILLGGKGDDCMNGGAECDLMFGGDGDDQLDGYRDQPEASCVEIHIPYIEVDLELGDFLWGGDGNDTMNGSDCIDLIFGRAGADQITANDGMDFIFGSTGADVVDGGKGGGFKVEDTDVSPPIGNFIFGGSEADVLTGGDDGDLIFGRSENDRINGGKGDLDLAFGGDGADTIHGDDGVDLLFGGPGNDVVHGDDAPDLAFGGAGLDSVCGDGSVDFLFGNDDIDQLTGGDGLDLIFGNDAADVIHGNDGVDFEFGGPGADTMYGDDSMDAMFGGAAIDHMYGGLFIDVMFGGDDDDVMYGEAGIDLMFGNDGADQLSGGSEIDLEFGGPGDDYVTGDGETDLLAGGVGFDTIHGVGGIDILLGGDNNDYMYGEDDPDILIGNAGNDRMWGGNDIDVMLGGTGYDTMYGEDGFDILLGGDDNDLEDGGLVTDLVLGNGQDDVLYGGDGKDMVFGGPGSDCINGDDSADLLFGGTENDRIFGGLGSDLLFGAADNDCLDGGDARDYEFGCAGADQVDGGLGSDYLFGNKDADTMNGDEGDDHMFGGREPDVMFGGADRDIMHGGTGNDDMHGGDGWDTCIGGPGSDTIEGDGNNRSSGSHCSACNVTTSQIAGAKFNDLNSNGVWNAGEPGIQNWVIDYSGAATGTVTTGANGSYTIPGLPAGVYTICEEARTGWTQTFPPGCYTIKIGMGESVTGLNFGNTRCTNVAGPVHGVDWLHDVFPFNETAGLPGTASFDTTSALVKTGRNIAQLTGNALRFVIPGDSLIACACGDSTRMDMVFRILPGPGNYRISAGRTYPLTAPMQLLRTPTNQSQVVTVGDASFWGQYLANNGSFGSSGGHPGGRWSENVWNSARMDTAELNIFPVDRLGNLPQLGCCLWMGTYHEADPKYATLGISKFQCYVVDTLFPATSSPIRNNVNCTGSVPVWLATLPHSYTGWNGANVTKEGTKIIPDGLLTPGSHVQYFLRRSNVANPAAFTMVPDTNHVTPQADEISSVGDACTPLAGGSKDGHRWQQFSVLPDRWKNVAFGGTGMAVMLYVDLARGRGDVLEWSRIADQIGATAPSKYGSHNGWHTSSMTADPNDPANFVRAHHGQAGTSWDLYEVQLTDDLVNGYAGSLGGRLGNRASMGFAAGMYSRIGPTPEMLRAYYRQVFITTADRTDGLLGPLPDRSQNEIALFNDFLTAVAGTPQPRGLHIMGSGFVEGETAAGLVDPSHTSFLSSKLGVGLRNGDYRTWNSAIFPDLLETAPGFLPSSVYGVLNGPGSSNDVLYALAPSALGVLEYENSGVNGPYTASVLHPNAGLQPWVALTHGFSLQGVVSRYGSNTNGRRNFVWDALTNIFGPLGLPTGSSVGVEHPVVFVNDLQVRANPAPRGRAAVRLTLAKDDVGEVALFDVAGRRTRVLANGTITAGVHDMAWDGADDAGRRMPAGVYFLHVKMRGSGFERNKVLVMTD